MTLHGLPGSHTLVVNLVSTLVLLDEFHLLVSGVETDELELAILVLTLARDLAALYVEFLKTHLVFLTVLLVPALPDAHIFLLC